MQRYFSKEERNNNFILNDDDIYHITRVMRMKTNDNVEVVYNHEVYLCRLEVNNGVTVFKEKMIEGNLQSFKDITLYIPLLKEQKMDLILQKATELGVNEIVPVAMSRCVVKVNEKEDKKVERWNKICKEAAEQSKRTDIPVVRKVKNLKELTNISGLNIICSTSEKSNLLKNYLNDNRNYDKINIVIGPEGGISLKEEEFLVTNGWTRVSLGKRIMRVETVPLFILSALNYEFME